MPLPTLAHERAAVLYNLAALYANLVRAGHLRYDRISFFILTQSSVEHFRVLMSRVQRPTRSSAPLQHSR